MGGLDPAALRRFDLKVRRDYLRQDQAWALLLRHCAQLGLPAPGATEQARMARLRQQRFRPLPDAQALVDALKAECALKQDDPRAIGFV